MSDPGGRTPSIRWGWQRALAAVSTILLAAAACGGPQASTAAPGPSASSPAASAGATAASRIGADDLRADLAALASIAAANGGNRAMGTPGYDASAAYVEDALRRAGWTVTSDAFEAPAFVDPGGSTFRITTPGSPGTTFGSGDVAPLIYAPPGKATGRIVALDGGPSSGSPSEPSASSATAGGGCQASDYPTSTRGAIALAWSGSCYRRAQVLAAQQAGAIGFIAANEAFPSGQVRRSTLISPAGLTIPAVAVSLPAARVLVAAAADPNATVTLDARATTAVKPTRSVIAELAGATPAMVVMAGAHLDSVVDGPGLNDNGSGVAALLSMGRAIAAGPRPRATIRLGFWSGEELGLIGSGRWVASHAADRSYTIVGYLNADMVGSVNGYAGVELDPGAPPGSAEIAALLRSALAAEAVTPFAVSLVGSSDGTPFENAGVPVAGLFTGALDLVTADQARASGSRGGAPADVCYHLACDGIANVDVSRALAMARALASTAERLAEDPQVTGQ